MFGGDGATAARTVTASVRSTSRVVSSVAGYYTRSAGYTVFRRISRPTATVGVAPAKPNSCVRLRTERVVSGAWRQVCLTGCVRLDRSSRRVVALHSRAYLPGVHYRIRFEWAGDAADLGNAAAWHYLLFR